jgi:hypothetical protein
MLALLPAPAITLLSSPLTSSGSSSMGRWPRCLRFASVRTKAANKSSRLTRSPSSILLLLQHSVKLFQGFFSTNCSVSSSSRIYFSLYNNTLAYCCCCSCVGDGDGNGGGHLIPFGYFCTTRGTWIRGQSFSESGEIKETRERDCNNSSCTHCVHDNVMHFQPAAGDCMCADDAVASVPQKN